MKAKLDIAVLFVSVAITAMFAFGVAASTTVPFGDSPVSFGYAVASLRTFSPNRLPSLLWFLPIAMVLLVTFLTNRSKWIRLPAIVVSILLPVIFLDPSRAIAQFLMLPFIAPSNTIGIFAGTLDGETWSEGFIALSAMGWWSILWVVVFFLELKRANKSVEPARAPEGARGSP